MFVRDPSVARLAFVLGANGLLGIATGFFVSGFVAALSTALRATFAQALAAIGGLLAAIPIAIALGLVGNRVLLRGAHFLAPRSLALDFAALLLSALVGLLVAQRLAPWFGTRALPLPLRPQGAVLLATLALFGVLLPRFATERRPLDPAHPPIVLVSIDTLRPDHLSAGGDPRGTSPEIDRLLRAGTQFANAVTVSPGSAGSHAALFTSRVPVSNGVFSNFTILSSEVETIAETLRARGYRTAGFATNTFLGRQFGFDQGFELYVESGIVERADRVCPSVYARGLAAVQVLDRLRSRLQPGYDPSFETALEVLREGTAPPFLFIHLMDVHSPYAPPPPYGPRFGAHPEGTQEASSQAAGRRRNRFGWRPSEEAYAAEIRFADAKIGRLVRALQNEKLFDDAIVILTSDHGENLLDHEPHFSHGSTLFDSTLRVLVAFQGGVVPPGRLDLGPAENLDVVPTLAALLDFEAPNVWEGGALLGPKGAAPARPFAVAQLYRDFAIRSQSSKIVIPEHGAAQSYNLESDPGETRPSPLSADDEAVARARIAEWVRERETPLYSDSARMIRPDELSPEVVERLRALGYVE